MPNCFWTPEVLKDLLNGSWFFFPDQYGWNPGYVTVKSVKRVNPQFRGDKINIIRRSGEIEKAFEEIKQSKKRGGCIIIRDIFESRISNLLKLNLPILLVPENGALVDMAKHRRTAFNGSLICVTGTAGKTSVRGMLHAILSSKYNVLQNRHNWNFKDHVFEDLASLSTDAEFVVLEVGLGQKNVRIAEIVDVLKPNISILTSIGVGHMDAIESTASVEDELESVFSSKIEIFNSMVNDSFAVIPSNIVMFDNVVNVLKDSVQLYETVGSQKTDSVKLLKREWSDEENRILISIDDINYSYSISAPGEHMAINSLLAVNVAKKIGMSVSESSEALKSFKSRSGRASLIKIEDCVGRKVTIFDDSRNSTPLSLKSAFDTFDEVSKGYERIAILGEVGEFHLGENMESYHRELVNDVRKVNFDKVFVMGNAMKFFVEEYPEAFYFENFDDLIDKLLLDFKGDCYLMLKASAHMKFKVLRDTLINRLKN